MDSENRPEFRYPSPHEKLSYKYILDSVRERQLEQLDLGPHAPTRPVLTEWTSEERQAIAEGLRELIQEAKQL